MHSYAGEDGISLVNDVLTTVVALDWISVVKTRAGQYDGSGILLLYQETAGH